MRNSANFAGTVAREPGPNPAARHEVTMAAPKAKKFSYDYPRPALTVDVVLVDP